jgi:hypothetical protein
LFITVGLLFLIGSTNYNVGQATSMGPGYFPLMLSLILILLGSVNIVKSFILLSNDCIGKISFRPLIFVLAANIAFGIVLPWLGLISAIVVLTVIASFANNNFNKKETILLLLFLTILSSIVFVGILSMPINLFPWNN